MNLIKRLFTKEQNKEENVFENNLNSQKISEKESDGWEAIPTFIEMNPKDYERISVIATAIAAGDRPDSQFVIKRILQRNPEARTVAIISASLVSELADDSQLFVKSIAKKKIDSI